MSANRGWHKAPPCTGERSWPRRSQNNKSTVVSTSQITEFKGVRFFSTGALPRSMGKEWETLVPDRYAPRPTSICTAKCLGNSPYINGLPADPLFHRIYEYDSSYRYL
jgi:hypothetical protein